MLYVYTDADGTHEKLMTGEELVAASGAAWSLEIVDSNRWGLQSILLNISISDTGYDGASGADVEVMSRVFWQAIPLPEGWSVEQRWIHQRDGQNYISLATFEDYVAEHKIKYR